MRWQKASLSYPLRSLATLALLAFVAAQVMCFMHCNFGGGHCDKAHRSCHGSTQHADSHEHDDDSAPPPPPSPTASCTTLKTMLAGADAPVVIAPVLFSHYLFSPVALAPDATATAPKASVSRQAWRRDWVFTPEVCLGPAFRSLAPPFPS